MFVTLILALSTVASGDPLAGSFLYTPSIGENAVLHYIDPKLGTVFRNITVYTDPAIFRKMYADWESEANVRERTKVLGNPKQLDAVVRRQQEEVRKALEKRGEALDLPDMTPVKVRGLATFDEFYKPVMGRFRPNFCLVEVLDGPAKGRCFWAQRYAVRVPGAEAPKPDDAHLAGDAPEDKLAAMPSPAPTPQPPATMLLVEGSSWNKPLDGFVQVHCRVKNTSGKALKFVIATVVFEDAAGNLVHSAKMIVGDLQPGDTKTVTSFDKHDARMDHYKFEFEGQDDSGKDRVLDFTTAGRKGAAGRR
jgi:hypothetical protein